VKSSYALLLRRMARVAPSVVSPSMFSERDALWVDGKEIAHGHDDGTWDLRLTRATIRSMRDELKGDPRVTLRSSTSDWIELAVATEADARYLLALYRRAVEAHAPAARRPRAPPTGAELARRRRFH
jgi:hypothetical protein